MSVPQRHCSSPRALVRSRVAARALLGAALAVCASACADVAAPPMQSHHRADGFQNNYIEFAPEGLAALLKWKLQALRDGLPPASAQPTPRVAPDLAFIGGNARAGAAMVPAITWIGHATMLAQLGGLTVVTDPIFSERASPVGFVGPKRQVPPGLAVAQLPHVDVVLISHNHYDHLDAPSVRALAAQPGGPPLFVVPLGLKAWMAGEGIANAVELDWWQSHTVDGAAGPVEIVMTPVQHWSGRGLDDRLKTLWGGYAVFAPDLHLYFAGDTGYSKDFADIRERFAPRQRDGGFDIALLPIGAYEPRWFMADQHVNVDEAVKIHRDVGARQSLGVHWGTFALTDEPLDEPPRRLIDARREAGLSDDEFFVLAVGETRLLAPRG
jgi:N-acyl-phosphatidylethanolamine-hydrolysing phospholipase D